jgi:hypothetical protein
MMLMNDDEMNRGKKKGFLMSITQKTNAAPKKKKTRENKTKTGFIFSFRGGTQCALKVREGVLMLLLMVLMLSGRGWGEGQ